MKSHPQDNPSRLAVGFRTCHSEGVLTERGFFQATEVMGSFISSPARLKLKNEPQSFSAWVNGSTES